MSHQISKTTPPAPPLSPGSVDKAESSPRFFHRNARQEQGTKQRMTAWTRFKDFFDLPAKFKAFQARRAGIAKAKDYAIPEKQSLAPDAQSVRAMLQNRINRYARRSVDLNKAGQLHYSMTNKHVIQVLKRHTDQTKLTATQRADVASSLKRLDTLFQAKDAQDLAQFRTNYPFPDLSPEDISALPRQKPLRQTMSLGKAKKTFAKIKKSCRQVGEPNTPNYTNLLSRSKNLINPGLRTDNRKPLSSYEVKQLFSNASSMLDAVEIEGAERGKLLKKFFKK